MPRGDAAIPRPRFLFAALSLAILAAPPAGATGAPSAEEQARRATHLLEYLAVQVTYTP